MIVQGFNSEIDVGDGRYHIQTENVGLNLITLIFQSGAVIARAKQQLSSDLSNYEIQDIRKLMQKQHNLMMGKLKGGELVPISKEEAKQVEKEEKDLIGMFLDDWAGES